MTRCTIFSTMYRGKICSADGCRRTPVARGLCNTHHKRLTRLGLPLPPRQRCVTDFWDYVDYTAGMNACWPWTGKKASKYKYGWWRKENIPAHRVAWEEVNGPVPEGLFVLHRCDNPPCCNPQHLFPGTHVENMADMVAKGRTNPVRGEDHYRAKLTEFDILHIFELRRQGARLKDIAAIYDIHKATACHILLRRSWKHVAV